MATDTSYLRVGSATNPVSLAGAIAGEARKAGIGGTFTVSAIGPLSVNQAVKGLAVSRGYLAPNGMDVALFPCFVDAGPHDDTERTRIEFTVKVVRT